MRIVIILIITLISGCAIQHGQSAAPLLKDQVIRHHIYGSRGEAMEFCTELLGYSRRACSSWGGGEICTIHYSYDDWEALVHEVWHCHYGSFHKE